MGVGLEILGELKRIEEPETGVSIIDLGIVEKLKMAFTTSTSTLPI